MGRLVGVLKSAEAANVIHQYSFEGALGVNDILQKPRYHVGMPATLVGTIYSLMSARSSSNLSPTSCLPIKPQLATDFTASRMRLAHWLCET
jgi:hypothetical protein